MPELKVGLIGLDTSHVVAFAKCLNKTGDEEHVRGAQVTHGFAGVSQEMELSTSRVAKFTNQLRDDFGVKILDTPEAVAEAVDLLFITSVDGRQHLDYVRKTIAHRRPTFIDKPMATSTSDAREIFNLGEQHHVPIMSCSSLRYSDSLIDAINDDSKGAIIGCDVFGPMDLQPALPGLYWYGIHSVEILNRVMGRGCKSVLATTTDNADVITGTWPNGRVASVRGLRKAHHSFGVTIHREKGFQFVDAQTGKRSWYNAMLAAIVRSLPNGKSDVDPADTMEIMRWIDAANESRQASTIVAL